MPYCEVSKVQTWAGQEKNEGQETDNITDFRENHCRFVITIKI